MPRFDTSRVRYYFYVVSALTRFNFVSSRTTAGIQVGDGRNLLLFLGARNCAGFVGATVSVITVRDVLTRSCLCVFVLASRYTVGPHLRLLHKK